MDMITSRQKEALWTIFEQKSIPADSCQFHGNTMNSLYDKGLINSWTYANGDFWQLTDLGLELFYEM